MSRLEWNMLQSQGLLKKLVPEFIELFDRRYTILRSIYSMQPVGRRTLASILKMGRELSGMRQASLRKRECSSANLPVWR